MYKNYIPPDESELAFSEAVHQEDATQTQATVLSVPASNTDVDDFGLRVRGYVDSQRQHSQIWSCLTTMLNFPKLLNFETSQINKLH